MPRPEEGVAVVLTDDTPFLLALTHQLARLGPIRTVGFETAGDAFEMPDWVCCAGGILEEYKAGLEERTVAANLLLAASKGADVVATSCSVCLGVLKRGAGRLDEDTLRSVAGKLGVEPPERLPPVVHVADLIVDGVLAAKLTIDAKRVALYPGCRYIAAWGGLRAAKQRIDRLAERLGIGSYTLLLGCCGFPLYASRPREAERLARRVEEKARGARVDVVVTLCPLCKVTLQRFTGLRVYLLEEVVEPGGTS